MKATPVQAKAGDRLVCPQKGLLNRGLMILVLFITPINYSFSSPRIWSAIRRKAQHYITLLLPLFSMFSIAHEVKSQLKKKKKLAVMHTAEIVESPSLCTVSSPSGLTLFPKTSGSDYLRDMVPLSAGSPAEQGLNSPHLSLTMTNTYPQITKHQSFWMQ